MKTRVGLLAVTMERRADDGGPGPRRHHIGIILGTTGPTASAGLPYKSVFSNLPDTVAGQKVHYIMVDDAGDPTTTVKDGRKLIGEDKVDLLIGSTSTPTCLALADVAVESKVAQICLSPIVVPASKQPWIFTVPQQVPGHVQRARRRHEGARSEDAGLHRFRRRLGRPLPADDRESSPEKRESRSSPVSATTAPIPR